MRARAGCRVDVGGGQPQDAIAQLLLHTPLWACCAGIALSLSGQPLPPSLDMLTQPLAAAHMPLALLAAGMTAPLEMPEVRHVY